MNPEPIAPAAPILVHSLNEEDSQDGYSQQQEVGDRINIDICTSEPCMHKFGAEKTARGNAVPPRIGAASYAGAGAISSDIRVDIRPPFCQQKELQTDLNADHEGDLVTVPPYASAVPPRQDSVHIQQTPELQPAISSSAELDLDEDPRYRCVMAEFDPHESQGWCSESCAKCYTHVMQLYSYRTCSRHIMQYQCGRIEDLVLNDKLRRAYVAGWAMLMSSVFPLAPNHAVRCFWALSQLILISSGTVVVFIYVFSPGYVPAGEIAYVVLMSLALLLAFCDTVSCFGVVLHTGFSQQRFQPPEAEPLLHRNQQTWSYCKDLLYRYNDFLRLIVAEVVIYITLVTALLNYCYENNFPIGPPAMIYASLSIFGMCVYVVQFLFLVKLTWTLWRQLKLLPTTRGKAIWLLLCFLLHLIGCRILQTLSLAIFVSVNNNLSNQYIPYNGTDFYEVSCYSVGWPVLTTAIFTFLTPVVSILTFFVLKHGWIQDLCIVYCTDYLSYLNTILHNPNTGQETKQSIRAALAKFEFETLMQESQKYRKWSRMVVNFMYPFLSPVMFVLCIPNVICLIALFVGARFAANSLLFTPLYYDYFAGNNNVGLHNSLIVSLIVLIFANNVHLVLVLIVWPVWECIRFYIYIMYNGIYVPCRTFWL